MRLCGSRLGRILRLSRGRVFVAIGERSGRLRLRRRPLRVLAIPSALDYGGVRLSKYSEASRVVDGAGAAPGPR